MILGLGSGSTARYVTLGLGERLGDGRLERIRGVPTSRATEALAREVGIPLVDLPASGVDLAIDGMDEVDPRLDAVKGLGGALLREKIVAESASRFVLVGDDRKTVARLGELSPVPVEILDFGHARTLELLRALGLDPELRMDGGETFHTDNGNPVADCRFAPGTDAAALAADLEGVPGVLGHGLFVGLAHAAYIASDESVQTLSRENAR